ncbi:MAG TPA: hypothetical protein VMY76_16905 [Gemmatimonadales bacterium]|nr:hypothetical protein [Gemmatimonadales bacterium]
MRIFENPIGTTAAGRRGATGLSGLVIVCIATACGGDRIVSSESAGLTDSTALSAPVGGGPESPDSAGGLIAATAQAPGIVYGTYGMDASLLNSVHTGTLRGGGMDQNNVISILSAVRSKGGRIVLKLCNGKDSYVKNSDGTFSFTKWKALVDRFKQTNFGPYLSDGTIIGHFLIDEPQRAAKWGGKSIPASTVEAMAKYSKQLWPGMTTFVRAGPTWLATSSIGYTYLDAGWAQYAASKGNVGSWIAAEVAAAKRKGLGLAVGLNVLDGGNGSSGIRGISGGSAMSANEIKSYGTALLDQSYACAFYNWMYDSGYYGRTDIKSAMAAMSTKAQSHQRTACRQ